MKKWNNAFANPPKEAKSYFCAYGFNMRVGNFNHIVEEANIHKWYKPLVENVTVTHWKPKIDSPYASPTIPDTEWISVEEQLPKENGEYLCKYIYGYTLGELKYDPENTEHPWNDGNEKIVVTHWIDKADL